jgi:selenocysteine lyase/cysteine desulfurase
MPRTDPPLSRALFPITDRCTYLNHAGVGPMPTTCVDAITGAAQAFSRGGSLAHEHLDGAVERVRRSAATLMGADVDDIAFIENTTAGLALVASGLDWHPGNRVIVPGHEFPSTFYPWIALRDRGVEVDVIDAIGVGRELPLERFADALDRAPARVVALSWVQFAYGWRTDLAGLGQLCREHGALLCVDAMQGLGAMPASFAKWGVDLAAVDAYKWMLGPHGIGVALVSDRARAQLRPREPGWASVEHREDFDNLELVFHPSARRYEGGSINIVTAIGMGSSIDLLLETGIDVIWEHVDGLCNRLADGLVALGAELRSVHGDSANRSGIVAFTLPGRDTEHVVDALEQRGIVTRPRAGAVRVSPHAYNTVDEIDHLLDTIRELS